MTPEWTYRPEDPDPNSVARLERYEGNTFVITFRDAPEEDAVGHLMADALNVHEATGLTPSQLQARVAELEAALQMIRAIYEAPGAAGREPWREVRRVLGVGV